MLKIYWVLVFLPVQALFCPVAEEDHQEMALLKMGIIP
jgi:hypothetical protein